MRNHAKSAPHFRLMKKVQVRKHQCPKAFFWTDDNRVWEADWRIAKRFLPRAHVRTILNGVFLPLRFLGTRELLQTRFQGGLCDFRGRFVAGRRRSFWNDMANFSCLRAYPFKDSEVEYRDEDVFFGGLVFEHYGHLLTDTTARLWYVVSHPEDTRRIVLLRTPEKSEWAPSDCLEFLGLAGISPSRILFIDRPTRFRSVLVPEEAVYSLDAVRPEWIQFFDAVRKNIPASPHKKVYLSRTHFVRGDTFNEELFEDYWEELGFHVLHPEDVSLREEVSLIAGADELVATIGTLSHNFLFAKPGARATVLLRSDEPQRLQMLVGAARGLRCDYVQAHRNILPSTHNDGAFWLAPSPAFRKYLADRNLPAFGEKRTVAAYARERIPSYVEKWMQVFNGRSDPLAALSRSTIVDRKNVERLRTALETGDTDEARLNAVCNFAETELARLEKLDGSDKAPIQRPAVFHGKLWWLARHFKLCHLRRCHDL